MQAADLRGVFFGQKRTHKHSLRAKYAKPLILNMHLCEMKLCTLKHTVSLSVQDCISVGGGNSLPTLLWLTSYQSDTLKGLITKWNQVCNRKNYHFLNMRWRKVPNTVIVTSETKTKGKQSKQHIWSKVFFGKKIINNKRNHWYWTCSWMIRLSNTEVWKWNGLKGREFPLKCIQCHLSKRR